jgi:hypothetical protein
VAVNTTLTINPGVVVKPYNELVVNGSLRVLGTAAKPVYFTSPSDDTIGGDTNGDGAVSQPRRADWTTIRFTSSSTNSLMDHAVIRYGGYGGNGAVTLAGASPTIRNSILSQNAFAGIRAESATPTLGCNNIYDNQQGIFNATTSTTVHAENQWWGSAAGPFPPNNTVNGGVAFTPWRTTPCSVATPPRFNVYLPATLRP